MRIFDETRKIELHNPDLGKGRLIEDRIQTGMTERILEVQEEGHNEVEKESPSGARILRWVVTKPGVSAQESEPIFEDVKIFIPFTEAELLSDRERKFYEQNRTEIDELDRLLNYLGATDFKTIQFMEGVLPESEFIPIKQKRQESRIEVRRLQEIIKQKRLQ